MNEYDDLIANSSQPDPVQSARAGFSVALDANPDEYAEARRVAQRTGVPVDTALNMPKEIKKRARMGEIDFDSMAVTSPATAKLLADIDLAKMSHDDVDNLSGFEQAARFLKNSGKALASGVPKFNEGMWGVLQAGGEALPSVVGDLIAGFAKEQRGYSKYNADQLLGKADGNLEAGWNSGLQSLGNNLLQLPLAIFGGATPLLTSMGLSTGGGAYGQARDQGFDRGRAFSFGATQGMIEVGTEMIGMPALLSMLKPGAFGKKALEYLYKDQFGEQIATHTQDLNEWASLPENKDKTFADYLAERPDAAIQTAIATAVGGGGQVAVMKAIEAVANRGAQREQEAQQAGQMGELLTGMTKLAEASKLRERDVETAQGFFQSVLDEGRDSVFITPEALAQSGLAEQIAQSIPAVAEQIQTASETGHDIRLPIAELMATMAGPELAQSIIPHVAVDPGGFTPTTAQEYMQSDKAAELQAEVEKILGEKQVDDTFKASAEIVKSRIISELTATTRWDKAKNEADATIYSAYYAVRAAQLGVTPETLYDQRRVNFSDTMIAGDQYGQGKSLQKLRDQLQASQADLDAYDGEIRGGVDPDGDKYFGLADKVTEAMDAFVADLEQIPDDSFSLQAKTKDGRMLLVNPSAQKPGHYQLTRFASDGNPWGDTQYPTKKQAIKDFLDESDAATVKDFGGELNQSARLNTDTPEFRNWFGESKVVSEDGKPMVVYHGTTKVISKFSNKKVNSANYAGASKNAHFFSENPEVANSYAGRVTSDDFMESTFGKGGNVIPAYISLQNPLVVNARKWDWGNIPYKGEHYTSGELSALAQSQGYDGLIIKNVLDARDMGAHGKEFDDSQKPSTTYVAFDPTQIKSAIGNNGQFDANDPNILHQSAYHGSPYRFDKFSLDHMGKGEGAQAFGWGLYFAKNKDIAEWYRDNLSSRQGANPTDMKLSGKTPMEWYKHFETLANKSKDPTALYDRMSMLEDLEINWNAQGTLRDAKENEYSPEAIKWFEETIAKHFDRPGATYEVEIPEDSEMLDWDTPLSEQPEKVRAALSLIDIPDQKMQGSEIYAFIRNEIADASGQRGTKPSFYQSFAQQASEKLNELGIKGIKFLDANSRDGSQAEGSSNYVVFDDAAISVLNAYYQNNETNLGKFSPDKLTVTMLQGANFTTTLHEGAHFFFENDIFLASNILADADIHGYDTLSVGEKQILLDVSKLMDWHGIQGNVTEQLRQWANMDFEEKRTYHERTAESFEHYLFQGEAPSIELQPYFQRFAAWWKKVYTSMKDFLAKNPEAGKLNPEIAAVFDRMLATTEQIQLAEQGRSMMPLFRTQAEAANIGMTPAEFEAYQHQDVDATNAAIEQLQARGLRDMQWSHNARGRVIKQLQKESAAKRAEVQMEARAEIMSQPIYRAWTFLTGRMTADDKVTAPKPAKSDPNVLDETVDSLFVAIAKLGGIKKDDVVTSWGVDPKDKPRSGLFNKPLWRVDGGLSIDGMAEALSQYGYLEQDENGKWDIRELEDKFKTELGGDTQFSNAYDYAGNQAPGKAGEEVINPDAVQAGRLSRDALADMGLPIELINHLVALKMVAKEGWHPDLLADKFKFESGDDMVRRIAAAESPKDAINGLTDQRMLERFGDLSSQEAIDKAADKAIHNEVRARMMATELNALENALGKRKTLASAAKEYASAMIGRVKVRDLKPGQYASAEARALKAAQAASKSGDIAKAAAEQRNALINNYATRVAHDAQDSIEKLRRDMASLANRSDDKLKKTYDMDLVNAVRAILGEYGIAEKKAKRAVDYLEVFKQNDPDMYAVVSEAIENASRNAKPYKELTVDDARALGEEVAAILHLAKRSRQMEVDGDMIDRQEIEDALHARLVALGIPESMPGDENAITAGEVAMQKFRTAVAALTRVESWVGKMDGADTFGPFRRYVFGRVKNAADAYRSDKAKYLKQFSDLFDSIKPTLKPAIIAAPELGYTFGKDAGGSAINEIVHAILHTGNLSNKRKLLLGRNWAQERPDGSLDTSRWDAFIQRMANEGKITKAHFDFAQGVWDLLESTKPLAQKTHRDVFGKYFDEVTAEQLNSPFGLYAGGYVPAMADSRIVADANMRALSEVENQSMQFAFPTTAKGFTKGRVEYNAPLMLDLRTLSQHIDKVLMFSHLEMPVRDVQRVMKGIGGTLNKVDPAAIPGLITPWLNRAAKQQVVTPISNDAGTSRFLSVMRSRAGAAAMFGNLANAVQQITGFSLASLKVRPSLMLSATADFAKHPKAFVAGVSEASPYMAERLDSEVAAMNDNINQILLNPSLLEKGQAWSMRHAYFLQTAIDSAMSPIIWTAAYNQALEQGHSHDDAVRLGDSAVRETQGSTLPEDISRIESGNAFVRLFTQFAGYFNMQANLLGTEYAKMIQQDYGLRKNASKGLFIFMMGFYVPAVVGELVMQLFKGGPGDDDKDGEYLDDWLAVLFGMAPLRTAIAMVPVAGQAINSAINAWNSKPYDDRIASSPAISMLESAAKAPVSVYNAVVNDGSAQKAVRDVATLISMTVGIPVNLAARPIGYAVGVADNKITPTSGPDMARGLVTGIASPDSKR